MGGKVKADMLNTSFLDYSQLTFAVRTMLLQILHPPMDGILWDSTSASVYLEGVSVFQVSKRQQRKIKHDIQSKKGLKGSIVSKLFTSVRTYPANIQVTPTY